MTFVERMWGCCFFEIIMQCVTLLFSPLQVKKMSSSSRALLFALALTLYVVEMASAETLCGGELVDALQFVCEDRGFYFSKSPVLYDFRCCINVDARFLFSSLSLLLIRAHLFG